MRWCVYYDNGSIFTDEDGPFEAAPSDGVICIARRAANDKVEFISGGDYYIHFAEDGSVLATSDIGPTLRRLGFIKFGRTTSHANFERVMNRVREDWKGK